MRGRPKKLPSEDLAVELRILEKRNPRWRDDAHCRALPYSVSDSLFFDIDTTDPMREVRRNFCNGCPVQLECRVYGDVNHPDYGAYGGYTATERRLQLRYKDQVPPYGAARAE